MEITITKEEYKELIIKAYKYDMLRKIMKKAYLTDAEKAILEIEDEEEKKDETV